MKKFEICDGTVFVGTAQEVKTLYKKLRNWEIAVPVFCDFPKFSSIKQTYGLLVEEDAPGFPGFSMRVVNGDFIADLVSSGEVA